MSKNIQGNPIEIIAQTNDWGRDSMRIGTPHAGIFSSVTYRTDSSGWRSFRLSLGSFVRQCLVPLGLVLIRRFWTSTHLHEKPFFPTWR